MVSSSQESIGVTLTPGQLLSRRGALPPRLTTWILSLPPLVGIENKSLAVGKPEPASALWWPPTREEKVVSSSSKGCMGSEPRDVDEEHVGAERRAQSRYNHLN